ncbi:hypothetical protein Tco_0204020 [Tanacetum coccineum]
MDEDELVPIILGRPFLVMARAMIDTEEEEEEDSNKALAISFYPRTEPVEPLKWKASKNQLKPSGVEPPRLELKELPEHLEYAFLQENNQILVVISSALSFDEKTRLLEVVPKKGGMTVVKNEKDELIPQWIVIGWREFNIKIRDKKCAKNLAADHLSQLEIPDLGKLTRAEIRDLFPEERLMEIFDKNDESCVLTESYEDAWPEKRQHKFFDNVTAVHPNDTMA